MPKSCVLSFIFMAAVMGCGHTDLAAAGDEEPASRWVLTFAEEGDGPTGVAPSPERWTHDLGDHGWGNKEWQNYTPGNNNAFYDGEGHLVIEARKSALTGEQAQTPDGPESVRPLYTSARLKTQGKFSQRYGKIEGRIKIPRGQGIWPAFWMLGDSFATRGWPACGEIDIMENVGNSPDWIHGTLHGPGYSGGGGLQGSFQHPEGGAFADDFHVYSVEWSPDAIHWFVDGELYHTRTPDDAGANRWAYSEPFFIILNVAVGGEWPGYPDETTEFPQRMLVDYVRVYEDATLSVDDAALAEREAERRRAAEVVERRKIAEASRPTALPGDLLAVNFKAGGEGVGYHDGDDSNNGGEFRRSEAVDIGACTEPDVEFSVGWTQAGEWIAYDVDVAEAGRYAVTARVANLGEGGIIRLEHDGRTLGEPAEVPDTGGWQAWQTVWLGECDLSKGPQTLRLVFAEVGPGGTVGNVAKLSFARVQPSADE
ncbi:MAG: family 16 glycosylhydrolase [Planctomycetota bacterium]